MNLSHTYDRDVVKLREGDIIMYTNIVINKIRKGNYVVVADSKRFGEQQVVFEGNTKSQCKKFIERAEKQQSYSPNMQTYYVTMTDTFLSGWGKADGKIAKYVIECESYDEALTVADNARNRSDMKHVRIVNNKPYYTSSRYQVTERTKEEIPVWFQKDAFKKKKK